MTKIEAWYRKVPVIRTKRLILRPFIRRDIRALRQLYQDPEIYRFTGRSMTMLEKNPALMFNPMFYNPAREKVLTWGIARASDNQIVGEILLYNIEGQTKCSIGCRVVRLMWGNGIAKEATKELLGYLHQEGMFPIVEAEAMKGNVASCKALEKSGFQLQKEVKNGKFASVIADFYIYRYNFENI
ncbi:MAG: GNAT family N-acetyltransferase [bacterium]|nr:GNAT family N-acetyltransferase [bacterium]